MLDYLGVLYIKIGDLTYPIPFKEVTHPCVYREAENVLTTDSRAEWNWGEKKRSCLQSHSQPDIKVNL